MFYKNSTIYQRGYLWNGVPFVQACRDAVGTLHDWIQRDVGNFGSCPKSCSIQEFKSVIALG